MRLATLTLVAGAFVAGCGDVRSAQRPNVVLVCLDTVRADHLGPYGYTKRPTTPFLDELAARSLVFERARATAGWTKPSVPSFLTGLMPSEHGVYEGSARFEAGATTDVLPAEAETLAERFQAAGYRTAAFVKNAQLRPGNGFEQGFDTYADEVGDAREIRWSGLDWIDRSSADGGAQRPFFLYLHVLDAHWPYDVPDEYASRFAPLERVEPFQRKTFRAVRDAIHAGEREFTDAERDDMLALYDGSLRYIDDQLRAFFVGLEQRGLADETVVCIVSDHGEEFGEHGRIGHGHGLYENLLAVPWILSIPGEAPRRIGREVSLLDVFPTLLGAAGVAAPARELAVDRRADPDAGRPIFSEHKAPDHYEQALRRGAHKLTRRFVPPAAGASSTGEREYVFPVLPGARWEAELEVEDGRLYAKQLEPRDEDPDDLPEVKGFVRDLDADGFRLGPIAIATGAAEVRPDDGVEDATLADGRLVKVRGIFEEGRFVAERIKLYAADEGGDFEVRGTVTTVGDPGANGVDRVVVFHGLGGLELAVDDDTEFKGLEDDGDGAGMSREAIVRALEAGAGATELGFTVTRAEFVLTADPTETAPLEAASMSSEAKGLEAELDALTRRLVEGRVFSADDRLVLTPDTLQRLEALGYVE